MPKKWYTYNVDHTMTKVIASNESTSVKDSQYYMMWLQQAQAQVHQQAQAHIKAQSLEAWWERFT